jgi:Arc/MetJ family transcription regulator
VRITVDIDEAILTELLELTGEKKRSLAVSKALVEYVKRWKASQLGRLLREGAFDSYPTNEEIERQDKPGPGGSYAPDR